MSQNNFRTEKSTGTLLREAEIALDQLPSWRSISSMIDSKYIYLSEETYYGKDYKSYQYEWSIKEGDQHIKELYKEIYTDYRNGLVWTTDGPELSFKEARNYIENLNNIEYFNINSWRLPTLEELRTLYCTWTCEGTAGSGYVSADCSGIHKSFKKNIRFLWSSNLVIPEKALCKISNSDNFRADYVILTVGDRNVFCFCYDDTYQTANIVRCKKDFASEQYLYEKVFNCKFSGPILILNEETRVKTLATANYYKLEKEIRQQRNAGLCGQRQKQPHSERFVPKYRLRSRQMDLSPLEFISQKLFILSKDGERGTWVEGWTKIKSEFVKSSEKIVCDLATGLMWQQSGSGKMATYTVTKQIIMELNKCNFNGFNDWRLPTIEELHSLYGWGKMEPDGGEPGQEPDWAWNPFSSEFEQKQDTCWSCDNAVSGVFICPAVGLGGQALSHMLRIEPNSQWVFNYGDDISIKSGIIAARDRMQKHWVRAVRTMTSATC